jgi:hypothetical protein
LKEVLDKNNVPNDRIVFEGVGHNLPSPANSAEVYQLMHDWFTRHSAQISSASCASGASCSRCNCSRRNSNGRVAPE